MSSSYDDENLEIDFQNDPGTGPWRCLRGDTWGRYVVMARNMLGFEGVLWTLSYGTVEIDSGAANDDADALVLAEHAIQRYLTDLTK